MLLAAVPVYPSPATPFDLSPVFLLSLALALPHTLLHWLWLPESLAAFQQTVSHGFGFGLRINYALPHPVLPYPWERMCALPCVCMRVRVCVRVWFCGFCRNYEHVTKSTKLINKLCQALPLLPCHVTFLIFSADIPHNRTHTHTLPQGTHAYTHVCAWVCLLVTLICCVSVSVSPPHVAVLSVSMSQSLISIEFAV